MKVCFIQGSFVRLRFL